MELRRRDVLAGGATLAAATLLPRTASAQTPRRGGTLALRLWDPPNWDLDQTISYKTHIAHTFTHSRLVKHKAGPGVAPGSLVIEGDLAESWTQPNETTYVFYLRRGVRWHNKPPVNGRELTAEDVKFTFDRFLTEPTNPLKFMLDPVDRVEVVDRYAVRFRLKEPFVWLVNMLANPTGTWIVAREGVEKYGDLKKPESAIGTGPFTLERYDPNVKTIFRRNPTYFRSGEPWVDGVDWLVMEDAAAGLAAYRTGQLDCGNWHQWAVRQQDLESLKKSQPQLM